MTKTLPAQVYFADFRARAAKESKCKKIERLWQAAGFGAMFDHGALTAIKLHFGERGNDTFLNPVFVRTVVECVRVAGGKPFLTDTNTLYSGSRHNAVDHLTTALEHGFGYATVNAPMVIADGLRGGSFSEIPIGKKHFSSVKIAEGIAAAHNMVVLSHFKGHEMAGFGGAVKNLAMGCCPFRGKCDQHASRFTVDQSLCIACGLCMGHCPEKAITWTKTAEGKKAATIDKEKCVGCGECLTVCEPKAVGIDWKTELGPFCERMAEYAYGAVVEKPGKVGYINFLMNITPDCDCVAWSDAPLVPDIGILASSDPVALDMACFDLVNKQEGFCSSHLKTNHGAGEDKFKGVWSYTTGEVQLAYAEHIGLGSRAYELVAL